MVEGVGDIGAGLGVQRAIALGLVAIAAGVAVEEVVVVDPDVAIGLLEADVVALTGVVVHKADVANLDIFAGFDDQAETVEDGIVAHALDGDTSAITIAIQIEVALVHIGRVSDIADEADGKGLGAAVLHAVRNNIGNARLRLILAVRQSHGVLVLLGDVEHSGAGLQGAIGIVRADGILAHESVALADMRRHAQRFGGHSLVGLLGGADDGHDLHLIVAGLQAEGVSTHRAGVLPHQLIVQLRPAGGGAGGRHVDVVGVIRRVNRPFNVSGLQPTASLADRVGARRADGEGNQAHQQREEAQNTDELLCANLHPSSSFPVFCGS